MSRLSPLRHTGLLVAVLLTAGLSRAQTVVYSSNASDSTLGSLNHSTLGAAVLGSTGAQLNGLAYDNIGGVLYGLGAGTSSLYTVNQTTGAATLLTTFSAGGNANGLAFDPDHHLLYLTDNSTNALYSYNVNTTTFTTIGTITGGYSSIEGLGYDTVTDTLFGVADDQDVIIKINTTTAAATALANTLTAGLWRGLDFNPTDRLLYGTRVGTGGILTSIDPTTGIGTDLGTISGSGDFVTIQGLAIKGAAAVPEPSTIVLLGVGGLVLGLARRRRA